jgi:hypothetical protein
VATTTSMTREIDTSLRDVAAETRFLPKLAEIWSTRSQQEQDSWYLEWRGLMAKLAGLDRAYRSDGMTVDQQARYHDLVEQLKSVLPIIERLDFDRPAIGLGA